MLTETTWGDAFSRLENYFFGAIAITGAYFSIRTINKQILQQIEAEEERRDRRFIRLRSIVLLELSALYDEVRRIMKWHEKPSREFPVDLVSFEARLRSLSEVIEFAPPGAARALSIWVAIYQVLQSRLMDSVEKYAGKNDVASVASALSDDAAITSEFINWAAFLAIMDSLFPFARGDIPDIKDVQLTEFEVLKSVDWYYVTPGIAGNVPIRVEKARRLLEDRVSKGYFLPDYWSKLGVCLTLRRD
jgi:hypothetical protein